MVHHAQYGDGVANPSRPPHLKGHSQSFTAGSNPNSAPMPSYSSQRRHQSQPSSSSRSFTPQPEPTFDLMSSAQSFGDVNFSLPAMSFDLSGSMSMPPQTSSYNAPGLPPTTYADDTPFDPSTEQYLSHGLPEYDPTTFAPNFSAMNGPDTSLSHANAAPVAPVAPPKVNSPFISKGPILAPPTASHQSATTDSIQKQPQTPRKTVKTKSGAAARNQPLLPAPAGMKTPLARRDSNANAIKRAVPDSPSVDHTSPRKAPKRSKLDEPSRQRELIPIPDAESFPPIEQGDETNKPPYTYAQMIALAIWKAPYRRRTLSQIYDFIRTTWCYYRKDDTWENSIRHNLSLHKKFFEKQARAKDDPGKGNYWLIIPGNERELLDVYLKERVGHDTTLPGKNMGVMSTALLEPSALPAATNQPFQEPMLPPQVPSLQLQFPPVPKLQPPAPMQSELSSDATIPASDHFDEAEIGDGLHTFNNSLDAALTSSPPAIPRRTSVPSDTPTRATRIGASSARTSGKRKRGSMVDSGYMTGLESSILRYGGQKLPVFSSEADTEFQGGGRAEDAIRKMRASSSDSPSKGRTRMLPPSSPLTRGSPLRYRASPSQVLAPATSTPLPNPQKQLTAAPSLPPPTLTSKYNNSPIRQHDKLRANVRSMLETPKSIRDYNTKYPRRRLNRGEFDAFAIFEDSAPGTEMESPLPANSAGRMLDELMSAQKNQKTPLIMSSPFKSFPLFPAGDENTPWTYESPSKMLPPSKPLSSPSKYLPVSSKIVQPHDEENWVISEALDSEVDLSHLDEPIALDLTQTFRSIGERPVGAEGYGPATLHHYG